MKGFKLYVLLSLVIIFLIGFIIAGKISPTYKAPVVQAINCNSVNLAFNATVSNSIKANMSTNTFFDIPVTNLGNVTETISLTVTPNGSVPFTLESAPSFQANVSEKGSYTSFGVYSPTKPGNYSLLANISSTYSNCLSYKTYPINITIVNSSS
ncbi:MAG: hypothetical protein CSMARM5_0033 [Candidatus Parvarchaeum acidophilus ARMAN-5_'5-way FS']|jgi:hypothetical protein|uniref:Uncharacterized protein n=2 Tax=Parvarchaeum acidophilus TaxID=662761 RepID=D6GWP4_PARA5|nr:MAG: hypothetical protein BJBARM5_0913 [Candidatus Parvarchaeum acidophilus ARMAN-5]EGD71928.1 MAG: hypothetical protein CSMARM5_0033 [Candidatus Parvarchaeum acidophilus ARMAN-5_'5-way FS']